MGKRKAEDPIEKEDVGSTRPMSPVVSYHGFPKRSSLTTVEIVTDANNGNLRPSSSTESLRSILLKEQQPINESNNATSGTGVKSLNSDGVSNTLETLNKRFVNACASSIAANPSHSLVPLVKDYLTYTARMLLKQQDNKDKNGNSLNIPTLITDIRTKSFRFLGDFFQNFEEKHVQKDGKSFQNQGVNKENVTPMDVEMEPDKTEATTTTAAHAPRRSPMQPVKTPTFDQATSSDDDAVPKSSNNPPEADLSSSVPQETPITAKESSSPAPTAKESTSPRPTATNTIPQPQQEPEGNTENEPDPPPTFAKSSASSESSNVVNSTAESGPSSTDTNKPGPQQQEPPQGLQGELNANQSQQNSTIGNDDGAEYVPPKDTITPVIEEDSLYSKRCKVYAVVAGECKDKGTGTLFIKKLPDEKYQIVVRAETNLGNILLNILLQKTLPLQKNGKKGIMTVDFNPVGSSSTKGADNKNEGKKIKGQPIILKLRNEVEADELLSKLRELQKGSSAASK